MVGKWYGDVTWSAMWGRPKYPAVYMRGEREGLNAYMQKSTYKILIFFKEAYKYFKFSVKSNTSSKCSNLGNQSDAMPLLGPGN